MLHPISQASVSIEHNAFVPGSFSTNQVNDIAPDIIVSLF